MNEQDAQNLRDNTRSALANAVPDAIAALKDLAANGSTEQVKHDAAVSLLDRGISAAKGFTG